MPNLLGAGGSCAVGCGRERGANLLDARRAAVLTMFGAAVFVAASLTPATAQATPPKQEAAALSVVAGAKAKSGSYKLCAEMYEQCYHLDPSFLGYLYSAARCAQKGDQLDLSERHYREFLLRAPAEHPLRLRANAHMIEIVAARKAAAAQRAAAEKRAAERGAAATKNGGGSGAGGSGAGGSGAGGSGAGGSGAGGSTRAAVVASPIMSGRALGGWVVVGGAALLAGAATWLALGARADADALSSDLKVPRGALLIRGLSYAQATDRNDAIRSRGVAAAVTGGAALVAAGVGAWLLWPGRDPAKSALRVSPGQLRAVWEVRW